MTGLLLKVIYYWQFHIWRDIFCHLPKESQQNTPETDDTVQMLCLPWLSLPCPVQGNRGRWTQNCSLCLNIHVNPLIAIDLQYILKNKTMFYLFIWLDSYWVAGVWSHPVGIGKRGSWYFNKAVPIKTHFAINFNLIMNLLLPFPAIISLLVVLMSQVLIKF